MPVTCGVGIGLQGGLEGKLLGSLQKLGAQVLGRRLWKASLPPIVLLLPSRSSLAPNCHGDHSHWGYIISRECPKFLSSPGDTHKPAIVTLLHDIHTVPLSKFQLVLILGPVLVHGPVRSPVYLCVWGGGSQVYGTAGGSRMGQGWSRGIETLGLGSGLLEGDGEGKAERRGEVRPPQSVGSTGIEEGWEWLLR